MTSQMPPLLENHTIKMLAIIEQWEGDDSCHVDNTVRYLFLLLLKMGLDGTVLYLCWRRLHTSFICTCGLSIVLGDVAMVWSVASVWFLGPIRSPVSMCFILAHFSGVYAALPLPMVGLGLLDCLLKDNGTCCQSAFSKMLKNVIVVLLVWFLAAVYSFATVKSDLMVIEHFGGVKALVCEVQESMLVDFFILGIFLAVIAVLLPNIWRIPKLYKEASRVSQQRGGLSKNQMSDLPFNSTDGNKITGEDIQVENAQWKPSLQLSLTLGFGSVWLPYLSISVLFLFLGFGVPAYIVVNLLWLECTRCLLVGVVFWGKSNSLGPYNPVSDNACPWPVYWHLSSMQNVSFSQEVTKNSPTSINRDRIKPNIYMEL